MIDSIKHIQTVRASDLPPTFDVRVGLFTYPMELERMDAQYVYVRSTDTDETIFIPRDEMVTILVPDTWENAKWDISFALMQEGAL